MSANRWYDSWWLEDLAVRISGTRKLVRQGCWEFTNKEWSPMWLWHMTEPGVTRSAGYYYKIDRIEEYLTTGLWKWS